MCVCVWRWQLLEVTADGVKPLADDIKWAKSTYFSWTHDHKGFFYSRYPAVDGVSDLGTEVNANENHQVWFHRVGTPQADDVFVFATPENPKYFVGGSVSDDGRSVTLPRSAALVLCPPTRSEPTKARGERVHTRMLCCPFVRVGTFSSLSRRAATLSTSSSSAIWRHSGLRVQEPTVAETVRSCQSMLLSVDPARLLLYVACCGAATAGMRAGMPIVKLVDEFIGKFDVIANEGSVVTVFVRGRTPVATSAQAARRTPVLDWEPTCLPPLLSRVAGTSAQTNYKSPKYRLIRTDLSKPPASALRSACSPPPSIPPPQSNGWRRAL